MVVSGVAILRAKTRPVPCVFEKFAKLLKKLQKTEFHKSYRYLANGRLQDDIDLGPSGRATLGFTEFVIFLF